MKTLKGGCLCGKTKYSITSKLREGYYCHCRMCQLAFGNIFATYINIKKSEIKWKNKPKYYSSSKFAKRGFCGTCGTPLTFEFNDSENLDISVGSLDTPNLIRPISHFAIEKKVKKWFKEDDLKKVKLKEHKKLSALWKKSYGNKKPSAETARKY